MSPVLDWLQGFIVGAAMSAAPLAFAVGMSKGQENAMKAVKAVPDAFGVALGHIKTMITKGKKDEPASNAGNSGGDGGNGDFGRDLRAPEQA